MGQEVHQDWAIMLPTIHASLEVLEEEWDTVECWEDKHRVASAGAYMIISFCGSFRGNKVFLMDLFGLAKYLEELPDKEHVVIPLLEMYKGEVHQCYHLTPMAAVTDSGVQVRTWLTQLLQVHQEVGRTHGPAFGNRQGATLPASVMEGILADRLQVVKESWPGVIPKEVDCYEHFRGATSTAQARGVDRKLIDLTNRWRQFESSKGHRPRLAMQDHYFTIEILVPELIKFSKAL
jgi:hypothetical protein